MFLRIIVYRKPRDSREVLKRLTGEKTAQCAKLKVSLAAKKFNTLGENKMQEQNNPMNSLAHTKWNCKYHIVLSSARD